MEKPRKSRKKLILMFIPIILGAGFLFVLLMFAGGVAYASQSEKHVPFFTSVNEKIELALWNPSTDSARDLLGSSAAIDSFTTEDLFGILTSTSDEDTSYSYEGKLELDMDISDDEFTLDGEFIITASGDVLVQSDRTEADFDITGQYKAEGTTFEGDGEIRIINDNVYVKVGTIPTLGVFDISEFEGNWYNIPLDDLEVEENDDTQLQLDILDDIVNHSVISENLVYLGYYAHPEEFNGVVTRCYEIDLDSDELETIIRDVNEGVDEKDKLDEDNIEEFIDLYDRFYVKFCLGKNDNRFYYVEMIAEVGDDEFGEIVVHVTQKTWDYGKEVNVDRPENAENLEDAVDSYFEEMYGYDDEYYYDDEYFYEEETYPLEEIEI